MQRKTRRKCPVRCVALWLLTAVLCASCAQSAAEETTAQLPEETTTRETFDLPPYLPRIVIDQNGYDTGAEKTAFFPEELSGATFEVRDALTDAIVYTGSIASGNGIASGTFTDLQTTGTYYIYTEETGSSYAFPVGDKITQRAADGALFTFYLRRCGVSLSTETAGAYAHDACHRTNAFLENDATVAHDVTGGWHTDTKGNRDTLTLCHALRDLLMSYQISADSYGDDARIPESGNGIPDVLDEAQIAVSWLLRMQDTQGAIYGGVRVDDTGALVLAEISDEATIACAEVLALYAYVYASFDASYAEELLTYAVLAWDAYTDRRSARQETGAFAAAAQLYRLTGERRYETVLSTFFNREDFTDLFAVNDDIFYGAVTYLETSQPVNVTVRRGIAETLEVTATQIAERAEKNAYLVATTDTEDLLGQMCRLAIANHISYNHAYVAVIENHMHYLYGRNPDTVNRVGTDTEYTYPDAGEEGVCTSLTRTAKLVLILHAL